MDILIREIQNQSRMAYQAAKKGMWHQWTLHASQAIGMLRTIGLLIDEGRLEYTKKEEDEIFVGAAMLEDQLQDARSGKVSQGVTNVANALWKQYIEVLKIGRS